MFIDEFQYSKHGGKILKYIFDTQKIKIIISVSSVADLTIHAIKYLVGRVLVVNLYPFDFKEFLSYKDPDYLKLYDEYKDKFSLSEENFLKLVLRHMKNCSNITRSILHLADIRESRLKKILKQKGNS